MKRQLPATRVTFHPERPPSPPEGLREAGRAAWTAAWTAPWSAGVDEGAIRDLASLTDERAELRASVEKDGPVLEKPIVTPKGDIAGVELYPHPGLRELRRIDTALQVLRDRLGLTPLYRARLGLALVELEAAETKAVAATKARYRAIVDEEPK